MRVENAVSGTLIASALMVAACQPPLPGSLESHALAASSYEQDYAIQVYVPDAPGPHDVVYVFDGDDWTDTVAGIVPDRMVVGIGYGDGRNMRARDYTPAAQSTPDGHGEVEAFYGFVEEDLIPWVDGGFDTVAERESRTVIGHSFGGTAALWAVFFSQEHFGASVVLSPSLAIGSAVFFEHEAAYAEAHDDLDMRVHLGAGGQEAHGLAGLTEAFGHTLASRDYPSLALQTHLEPGHVHSSVFPVAAERGLDFVLEGL